MGYRSEIALTMFESDYQEMLKKAYRESKDVALPFITRYAHLYKSDDIVTIYWDWVKWYEEYEDVRFVIDFIHNDIPYKFTRVGESVGDIEEEFNGENYELCDVAYATCSISLDAGDMQNIDNYLALIELGEDEDNTGSEISDDELYKIITA